MALWFSHGVWADDWNPESFEGELEEAYDSGEIPPAAELPPEPSMEESTEPAAGMAEEPPGMDYNDAAEEKPYEEVPEGISNEPVEKKGTAPGDLLLLEKPPQEEVATPEPEFMEEKPMALVGDSMAKSEEEFDPRYPVYTQLKPDWGVFVGGSHQAFGTQNLSVDRLIAVTASFEWEPRFLQAIGVVSLGPSLSIFPAFPAGSTLHPASIWGAGGRVQYQARFFRNQIVVPYGAYAAEYWGYSLKDGPTGRFLTSGPVVGGMILLNVLDPSSAAEFYVNHGALRSYLTAEMRFMKGDDGSVSVSGPSYYFGIRVEY